MAFQILADHGGNLVTSIIQLAVFLAPVPILFFFLVRAMLRADDDD